MSALSDILDLVFPKDGILPDELASRLDAMSHEERLGWARGQNLLAQSRLWELVAGRGVTLQHLVPDDVPLGTAVTHFGKNTLPVFTTFEKPMVRDASNPSLLYGYNEGATRPLLGPGYFVAEFDEARGEVGVNYYRVPPASVALPMGWPPIKPNEEGLQRFVFASMVDYLRKLSHHVSIGRAYKSGTPTHNYFLLVRQD